MMHTRVSRLLFVGLLLLLAILGGAAVGALTGIPPEFVEEPADEIVRRHDPLTLYCKAAGVPIPEITWYRTGSEEPLSDKDSRLQLPDGSLFFYRVRGRDAGTYFCVAHSLSGTITSRRAKVQLAYLREDFRKWPSSLGVVEGESAMFECDPPKGNPTPVLFWQLDGEALVLPRHRYRQEGTTLVISRVTASDEGEYQCVVTNMAGTRTSRSATLTVFEAARVGGVVKSMVGVAGHDVTMPCAPSGTPDPQVIWRRADGRMPLGRASVGRDWGLTIMALRTFDEGVYVCQASNTAGSHSANTSLIVVEPPRMEGGVRPRITVVTPGHVRKIACPVTATPAPLIFWLKENHEPSSSSQEQKDPSAVQKEQGDTSQYPGEEPRILLAEDSGEKPVGSEAVVDTAYNLHVTTHQEGLWACMAVNEVGGMLAPVHVVGGGVPRASVGVGVMGVDEVEARAALLTPTLEQRHPSPTTPKGVSLSWRIKGQSTHTEGIFVLGCDRGFGFVPPRIHQLLQTHDITEHRLYRHTKISHLHTSRHTQGSSDFRRKSSGSESRRYLSNIGIDDDLMMFMQRDEVIGGVGGPSNADSLGNASIDWSEPHSNSSNSINNTFSSTRTPPVCSSLRVLGYTPAQGRTSYEVHGLQPFTSYWFFLVPHYKGVLGSPSNLQAFTTPQHVPSGWAVLSRWWAAQVNDGFYALTLHWRPLPPHLAHGVITKYLVMVRESDTGVTHNVSVLGDLTTLTLPNVTSSRVVVTLSAATVKGLGPASPPARLNLLLMHIQEPGMGVGVVRSAWFLVLAGGAVSMVVVLVACTVTAKWCARGLTHSISRDPSKSKVCSVGDPWGEVGGLWAAVGGTDQLNSDKSERKLLTSLNESSNADYAEVEATSPQFQDDLVRSRLGTWPPGLLCPSSSSHSPSRSSVVSQHTNHQTQAETLPSTQPAVTTSAISSATTAAPYHSSGRSQHTARRGYITSSSAGRNTSRDSDSSTWYTGECCACCHEDIKLMVPQPESLSTNTPSSCPTVLANLDHAALSPYSAVLKYQLSGLSNDTYEAVTAYEGGSPTEDGRCHEVNPHLGPRKVSREIRLNTESTTDLSVDCCNFSDGYDVDTQSCSDTEASFFIPLNHDRRQEAVIREEIMRPLTASLRSNSEKDEINLPKHIISGEEQKSSQRKRDITNTLKCLEQTRDSVSTSGMSSLNPRGEEFSESSGTRRLSSRSSVSQDSLEEQFERTLNVISQGGSCTIDSDYLSTCTYN